MATLLFVGRVEGDQGYAYFAVVWAVHHGIAGIFGGLQQEVTKASYKELAPPLIGHIAGPAQRYVISGDTRWSIAVLCGSVVTVMVLSFPMWRDSIGASWWVLVWLVAGAVGISGLVVTLGMLAAQGRWRPLAGLLVADSGLRLVAVILASSLSNNPTTYSVAVALGSWVWVPSAVKRLRDGSPDAVGRLKMPLNGAAGAMLSTGTASLLIAGLPWIVAATSTTRLTDASAANLAALVFLRSPVIVIFYGVRPLVLREFLVDLGDVRRRVRGVWLLLLAAGLFAASSAALLGPAFMGVLLGSDFEVASGVASAIVASAFLLVMATYGALAGIALDRQWGVTASWLAGFVATVGIMVLPLSQQTGLVAAVIGGPSLVLVAQLVLVRFTIRSDHGTQKGFSRGEIA
ncbi:hypothetical protein [Nocardioides salsibiostraticola]